MGFAEPEVVARVGGHALLQSDFANGIDQSNILLERVFRLLNFKKEILRTLELPILSFFLYYQIG